MEDLYCPNPFCKQPNPLTADFCQGCHTFLPKRYLWLVGQIGENLVPGTLINDRYLVLHHRILVDRYPANTPEISGEISSLLETYLRLSYLTPSIPKVYSVLNIEGEEAILLEETGIQPHIVKGIVTEENYSIHQPSSLMPTLQSEWANLSSFRLLNYIYQIAALWEPFSRFNVTETLFQPDCIRVDGNLIKILELKRNSKNQSNQTLPFLLQHLIHYKDRLDSLNAEFEHGPDQHVIRRLREMYEKLIHEAEENHSYLLSEWLDHEIANDRSGSLEVTIVTQTDQGPNRSRNEDACYPSSGQRTAQKKYSATSSENPLLVVCDGIGGHEGGNIASNLVIQNFVDYLDSVALNQKKYPSPIYSADILSEAILKSNDVLSERNDQESRSDRQRMGTTLVAAHLKNRRLQIAHVGDSRAYRITERGCCQLTVDDDIASREVRLGYTVYRDALQHGGSGALTQALGMVPSSLLHPSVQTSFIDEDCIYLLCSDGLSDFDRIEEFWAQELIPVLQGRTRLVDACQNLIEIANAHNGHDNVTVGLLQCKVVDHQTSTKSTVSSKLASTVNITQPSLFSSKDAKAKQPTRSKFAKTQIVHPSRTPNPKPWIFLLSILAAISIVTGLIALLFSTDRRSEVATTGLTGPSSPKITNDLKVNQLLKVLPPILSNGAPEVTSNLDLLPNPGQPAQSDIDIRVGEIKPGTVVRVVDRQLFSMAGQKLTETSDLKTDVVPWVKLQVCTTETSPDSKQLKAGVEGWHAETTLRVRVTPIASSPSSSSSMSPSPIATNGCPSVNPTASPTVSSSPSPK